MSGQIWFFSIPRRLCTSVYGFKTAVGYDGTIGDTLRIDRLVGNHSLLLMARLGHSTLAPTTTKRELTRISLPPPRVL